MNIQTIPQQRINGILTPLNLSKVDSIVLHHAAHPTADVKTVERWHVNDNGWDAIGYNYFVALDGSVYEGRGLKYVGAGVAGHNSHIISVCFQGDYDKNNVMPDLQFNAGVELIEWIIGKLTTPQSAIADSSPYTGEPVLKCHRDFGGTVCPGKFFPADEIKTLRKRSANPMIYNYIDENMPEWARPYVQKAVDVGIIKGNEHGELNLTDDKIWTLVVILRATGVMK